MMASYVLSRTLVPLLSRMLMKNEKHGEHALDMFPWFTRFFDKLQGKYINLLKVFLDNRAFVLWVCLGIFAITMVIPFVVGKDFFPSTDTGLMKLHFRAPSGTRIEETEKLVAQVEDKIREIIPKEELLTINSMVDVPTSYNLGFVPTSNVGSMDAEISVALEEKHHPTVSYMKKIREEIALLFPGSSAYFQPADIVNQVLNFGMSAPIDIQFEFNNIQKSYEIAQELLPKLKGIPGLVDLAIPEVFDYPTLELDVDRVRASQLGITQRDVANSMLISLSSSSLVYPSYFLNPQNSVNYVVSVKVPLSHLSTVNDLLSTTITPGAANSLLQTTGFPSPTENTQSSAQRLGNLVTMRTINTMDNISHVNVQRVLNILGSAEGRDLGSVLDEIDNKIKSLKLPDGMHIHVRGQGEVMHEAFSRLGLGLIVAILLVYLLMVVLFQTWIDPFIVIVAVPGALTGILWTLLLTGTTINVVSFMGSIMAVGIAASNSILLVSFANDLRVEKGVDALEAALEAGKTRIRPVLMTALAMILGMFPTALALGEGGEQNAPLGRVVIGGLLVATCVTLFIVPIVYSLLRVDMPTKHLLDEQLEKEESELDENKGHAIS
jgi:multidrug efflux pump subunit AcrB